MLVRVQVPPSAPNLIYSTGGSSKTSSNISSCTSNVNSCLDKYAKSKHKTKNMLIRIQVVIANEGNVEEFEIVILILVSDEYGESIYEKRAKINSIKPLESRSYFTDPIDIEPGVLHEWFIKIEEIENEEELDDNLFTVSGFIPPEG